ncbi:hypothetical protein [Marinovum sp.]|uniref:hypothetical protein n=1 Tax=Marinovum sp. TaxID=2024839 RepID=UPI003A903AAD
MNRKFAQHTLVGLGIVLVILGALASGAFLFIFLIGGGHAHLADDPLMGLNFIVPLLPGAALLVVARLINRKGR